jgi:glycosyltransferase involved in cell wall biosynthesis
MRATHLSIIHPTLDTRVFWKECRALAAAGYDVHLVVAGARSDSHERIRLHSIAQTDERPRLTAQLPRQMRAARHALALWPSIYHLHDPHLIPLGLALKLAGARVVYDVHEDYPAHARTKLAGKPLRARLKALMWRAMESAARHSFDAFVCTSAAVASRFPAARTVIVGNLPQHREFEPSQPYSKRPNTVIYTGAISEIRGFWEMVGAIRLLPRDLDCKLRIVGPARKSEFARTIARVGEPERLEVVPSQPFPRVVRELEHARIGLVVLHPRPNHMDAVRSNKLFEYMAAGLPVITSDFPRWREFVRGLDCGLVVDPLDPEALAAAIEYLLRHPAEAEAMGQRGREAVRAGLNWDAEGARLLSLYGELAVAPVPIRAPALETAVAP